MPLTDTYIKNLKYPGKPKKFFDSGGLFLFFSASGNKLWRMAYRFDQKTKPLSFGESVCIHHRKNGQGFGKEPWDFAMKSHRLLNALRTSPFTKS